MTSSFFIERLPDIQRQLEVWWEHGDQPSPCLLMTIAPEAGVVPDTDDLERWWMDVDFIIERQMQVLDAQRYYGQAVPHHYVDRSASAMPGVLGARMKFIDKETMWAYPCLSSVEEVAVIALDPTNAWYRTAIEITKRSVALAKGHHYVGSYALGGITDIMAGLYGTEDYLIDLIAKPQAVAHAMEHVKQIWIACFREIQEIMARSGNYGAIGWAGIWAPGTTFPLQEDFSYMISDEMFKEFCLPHIMDQVEVMDFPLYHLDGIGALCHLNTLLDIEKLKVIQWVPGAGKERLNQWYGVIRQILNAGKSVQVYAQPDEVDALVENVGPRGLLITVNSTDEEAKELAERYSW
jgi:hypothetical protein